MINNNNQMNNNNSSNNINAMENSNTTSISTAMATPDSAKREPEAIEGVYKAAARRLREYHGVPSMTAVDLQKTLSLLQLHPRRLVVQGLAPSRLLRSELPPSLVVKESLGDAKGGECEIVVAEKILLDDDHDSFDMDYSENEADTKTEKEGANQTSADSESDKDASTTKDQRKGKANHAVHTALLAGGVPLHPRETGPLLRALGVNPHRLVRLGLVERGALHAITGGRGHGPHKHRRGGRRRAGGMGGPHGPPRHGSPDVAPHGPLGCGPPCGGTHRRPAPPRRGHGYFGDIGDFGEQPHGESGGEEEGMPMRYSPGPRHGPDRHCRRHHGGGKMGKTPGPPHGRPGLHGLERGSMYHGPGRFGVHPHEENGGEEIVLMHAGSPGSPQGRGHHGHHDGPTGHRHGPMHGRRGPRGRMHAPPGSPPPPPPPDHYLVWPTCCAGEEAILAPPGPGHHGSPTTDSEGGMPPHGPLHGLFHGGAAHAPRGRMERLGHGPPRRGVCVGRGSGMHGGGNFCGGGGVSLQHGRMGHRFGRGVHCGHCPQRQHQQEAY